MFNFFNLYLESGKVVSRLLRDDYTFSDFWHDYGVLLVVLLLSLIGFCILFLPPLLRRRKEKREENSVSVNGRTEKVYRPLVRKVVLYNHEEILLKKGDVFSAPLLEKDGYSFAGWFYDTAFSEPYKTCQIRKDITLYPKWVKHS